MAEILFSPLAQPGSLELNVTARQTPTDVQEPTEGDGNYLEEHLLLTRSRILELEGVFNGLHAQPSASQASGVDRRPTTDSTVDLDFQMRLVTDQEEGESSRVGSKGLSINFVI